MLFGSGFAAPVFGQESQPAVQGCPPYPDPGKVTLDPSDKKLANFAGQGLIAAFKPGGPDQPEVLLPTTVLINRLQAA